MENSNFIKDSIEVIKDLQEENAKLKKALKKIVKAGDLWGSEGKQHHEAIYIARCALALTSFQK